MTKANPLSPKKLERIVKLDQLREDALAVQVNSKGSDPHITKLAMLVQQLCAMMKEMT